MCSLMVRLELFVVLLAGLLVAAPSAATGPTALASDGPDWGVTELDSCTTIDTPGRYELTSDVIGERQREACFEITASDVILDGNGHLIQGYGSRFDDEDETSIRADTTVSEVDEISNLTVRNATITRTRMQFRGVDGLTLENLNLTDPLDDDYTGISIGHSSEVSVLNTTVSDYISGVSVYESRNVRVENGTFVDIEAISVAIGGTENGTLAKSSIWSSAGVYGSKDVTVVNNTAANEHVSFQARGRDLIVANNQFSIVYVQNAYRVKQGPVVIRDNVLRSPPPGFARHPVPAVYIHEDVNATTVRVRGNVLNATGYGVENQGEGYVEARNNYWGDPSGPSSPPAGRAVDPPIRDPRTGILADGDGSPVSVSTERRNTSNVCFDPWKDTAETGTEREVEHCGC